MGLDGPGGRTGRAGSCVPGLHCGREADEHGESGRNLPPLPSCPSGRGSLRRGDRREAIAGVGRSRKSTARTEGDHGDADGWGIEEAGRWSSERADHEDRCHLERSEGAETTRQAMTTAQTLKRTALYEAHRALGAKMVPFAGWEMPVQYPTGILAEHHAVRTSAGVFDVSHMGEFEISGPDRNAFVNRVTCNDVGALESGQVQYSGILTPEGTFIDDCTVYRFEDKLMIVVNASNTAKAWEHIVAQKGGANVRLKDISNDVGLLSIQGPNADSLVQPLTRTNLSDIPYYHFTTGRVADAECFISRTGYTGEDGFELYCRDRDSVQLWEALTKAGAKPIGLG